MRFQHYSPKYGYIDKNVNEQIGKGFIKTFKPLMKTMGKELLKGGAQILGNKLGHVIADKLSSKKDINYQPDTMLAIAQNARKKVFEDLNIIPTKQTGSLPSKEFTTKVLSPGFIEKPVKIVTPINHMMIGTGANISKVKKKKILTKMKFFK